MGMLDWFKNIGKGDKAAPEQVSAAAAASSDEKGAEFAVLKSRHTQFHRCAGDVLEVSGRGDSRIALHMLEGARTRRPPSRLRRPSSSCLRSRSGRPEQGRRAASGSRSCRIRAIQCGYTVTVQGMSRGQSTERTSCCGRPSSHDHS